MKKALPTITAFKDSPDEGQGMARDMRVRWAFEEVGQAYEVELFTFEEMAQRPYHSRQPFGQIPAYQEGDLKIFESGAIVLHLAERHAGLLPAEANPRARAITWLFAALNTVEPPIVEREAFAILENDKPYYQERLPMLDDRIHARMKELAAYLGNAEWLDGSFTVGDLMMVMVLRRAEGWGILEKYPSLLAYIARGEARPAYQRAFAAQLAVFRQSRA